MNVGYLIIPHAWEGGQGKGEFFMGTPPKEGKWKERKKKQEGRGMDARAEVGEMPLGPGLVSCSIYLSINPSIC